MWSHYVRVRTMAASLQSFVRSGQIVEDQKRLRALAGRRQSLLFKRQLSTAEYRRGLLRGLARMQLLARLPSGDYQRVVVRFSPPQKPLHRQLRVRVTQLQL